jgi:hypothetical protein
MNGTEIKREFQVGCVFDLTNHYITREDHPCFGTRLVRVNRSNSAALYTSDPDGQIRRIEWPKASQLERDENGTIRFYGGGIGQAADELFLTFEPVQS